MRNELVSRWSSRLVYPLSLLGFGIASVSLMSAGLAPPLVTGCLGLPIVVWVASWERWLPYRDDWNRTHGDLKTDFLHLVFSATAVQQLMAVLLMTLAAHVHHALGVESGDLWPSSWPLLAQLLFAFVITELLLYGLHRFEHESWLWPLHAVHHSAPRLYWMNSTRFHPLDEVFLAAAGFTPLMLLGCPAEVTAIAATLAGVNGAFKHANVDTKLGPLNYVVSMAELHRVHHSPDPQRANSNYGGNLMLWDLIFGTLRMPDAEDARADVGLGTASPAISADYLSQLVYPFAQWARHHVTPSESGQTQAHDSLNTGSSNPTV
jgi:ornithine lipid hydroxylase